LTLQFTADPVKEDSDSLMMVLAIRYFLSQKPVVKVPMITMWRRWCVADVVPMPVTFSAARACVRAMCMSMVRARCCRLSRVLHFHVFNKRHGSHDGGLIKRESSFVDLTAMKSTDAIKFQQARHVVGACTGRAALACLLPGAARRYGRCRGCFCLVQPPPSRR
jgi:hypothetical protein